MTARRLRAERAGDLSESQLALLSYVCGHGPVTPSQLAEWEQVSAPCITRSVAALERAGFASRRPGESDRRQVLVDATPEGHALVEATRRRRDAWLERRIDSLTPDECDVLGRAADILRRIASE